MAETLEADYPVVGAGAAEMAFVDGLIDHADLSVLMVDRRHSVGGHSLDAAGQATTPPTHATDSASEPSPPTRLGGAVTKSSDAR